MTVNMATELTSLDGEVLEELEKYGNPEFISKEETPEEQPTHTRKKKLILRSVCVGALMRVTDSDKNITGAEKNKRFLLALKLQHDTADLQAEDIVFLKGRIGLIYNILVTGRAWQLLEKEN